jgi:hypothetical protein
MKHLQAFIFTLIICITLAILEWYKLSRIPFFDLFTLVPYLSFLYGIIYIIVLFNIIQSFMIKNWFLFLFSIIICICIFPAGKNLNYITYQSSSRIITDKENFIIHTLTILIFYFNLWILYSLHLILKKKRDNRSLKNTFK